MFFHNGLLNRLTTKMAILLIFLNVLCGGAIIVLYVYQVFEDTTILAILLFLNLILIGILSQSIFSRYFRNKMDVTKRNVIKYKLDDFNLLADKLKKAERKKHSFGTTYFIYHKKTAFKITLVEDTEKYFNAALEDKENKKKENNPKLEACDKFCGFEIFKHASTEEIKRIAFFSFQNEKVYFAGCAYNETDKVLSHYNAEKPSDTFKESIDYIIDLLDLHLSEND